VDAQCPRQRRAEDDAGGQGSGRFAAATNIEFDTTTNQLRVNNYAAEPVRLKNVKIEK